MASCAALYRRILNLRPIAIDPCAPPSARPSAWICWVSLIRALYLENLDRVQVLDARRFDQAADTAAYVRDGTAAVFMPPGLRLQQILASRGDVGNRMVLINADAENPAGRGFDTVDRPHRPASLAHRHGFIRGSMAAARRTWNASAFPMKSSGSCRDVPEMDGDSARRQLAARSASPGRS